MDDGDASLVCGMTLERAHLIGRPSSGPLEKPLKKRTSRRPENGDAVLHTARRVRFIRAVPYLKYSQPRWPS